VAGSCYKLDRPQAWSSAGTALGDLLEPGSRSRTGSVSIFLMMRRCWIFIEAIYQALYVQGPWSVETGNLSRACTGRALRVPRARRQGKRKNFLTPEVMIFPAAGRG